MIYMKKKQYLSPLMQVMELGDNVQILLAGSGEPGTAGTNVNGTGKARSHRWDDEEYYY